MRLVDRSDMPQNRVRAFNVFWMLFLPAGVFVLSIAACALLDQAGLDQRYLSLALGFPAMIVAIGLAISFGLSGQKLVGILGALFWIIVCVFNILVTFAFWNG